VASRVQTIRYYTTLERPPVTEFSGELYINFADIQIGALDTSKSPVDFVAVRYYSQLALYVAGDFVIYNGSLYRCLQNNTQGAFDNTKWSLFADLQEIQVLIAIETQNRINADQVLQNEIDAETTRAELAEQNLQNEINATNTALANVFPPGVSMDYYGVNAPAGWLLEDGSVYNISTYPALGALLGNRFGGNGTTTFAVPPSLNRFGVTAGSSFPLGSMGGSTTAALNLTNLPSHTHTIQPHGHTSQPHTHQFSSNTIGMSVTVSSIGFAAGVGAPPAVNLSGDIQPATVVINNSLTLTTDPVGGGTPINILPPYISRTRIIKT
jgi:microcystin-dependent protein